VVTKITKYNIFYDKNLLIYKNLYKPYVVGDNEKYLRNKKLYGELFGFDIQEFSKTGLMINKSPYELEANTLYWLAIVVIEKIVNATIVNLKNIIFTSSDYKIEKLKCLEGEIDIRYCNFRSKSRGFRQSRRFLFVEMPVSALKITIIKIPQFKFCFFKKPKTFNTKLKRFMESIH
jgi:hypothetical protein